MSETRKSIVFQAKFDTSDLGQAVETIKRQMDQANIGSRMAKQGMGGIVSLPKSEDISKSKRELEMMIRATAQSYEKNLKSLEKEKDLYKSLQAIKREDIKDKERLAKFDNDSLNNLKERVRLTETVKAQEQAISGGLDSLGGRRKEQKSGMEQMKDFSRMIGMPLTIAGIAAVAAKAITQYAALPREITVATGAATQGMVGDRLQELQSGEALKSMAFKSEWQDSLKMAATERKNPLREEVDRWKSMNGFIGGLIGGDFENAFQAEQGQKQMANANSIYSAKIQNDPLKMAAASMYQQNYMRDLGAQRTMGLSDQGYFGVGGFQERSNRAGFNPELGLGMMGQIQGAGGSTRGMQGLSTLGLQAQRGFDLTNAGGVLGRISGQAGGGKESEQIFRKLMEESISAGLDKSEFREEQRRFADATSEILANSGVKTAQDAAMILAGFSKYLGGEPTVKGLEGARSAYEKAQAFSAETSGRGGALQFSAFMQDSTLRKAGGLGIGGLMEMPEKDIVPSNQFIISEANKLNISPEELVGKVKDAKRKEQLGVINLSSKKVGNLRDALQARGLSGDLSASELKSLPEADQGTYTEVLEKIRQQYGYNSPQEAAAAARGIIGTDSSVGMGGAMGAGMGQRYDESMGDQTGRRGDVAVAASGAVAQEFLENFRDFSKAITPTTEAVTEWTKALMMSAAVLRLTSDSDKPAAQKALADLLEAQRTNSGRKNTQSQVGTPTQGR